MSFSVGFIIGAIAMALITVGVMMGAFEDIWEAIKSKLKKGKQVIVIPALVFASSCGQLKITHAEGEIAGKKFKVNDEHVEKIRELEKKVKKATIKKKRKAKEEECPDFLCD